MELRAVLVGAPLACPLGARGDKPENPRSVVRALRLSGAEKEADLGSAPRGYKAIAPYRGDES